MRNVAEGPSRTFGVESEGEPGIQPALFIM